jgi:hypothetical protein
MNIVTKSLRDCGSVAARAVNLVGNLAIACRVPFADDQRKAMYPLIDEALNEAIEYGATTARESMRGGSKAGPFRCRTFFVEVRDHATMIPCLAIVIPNSRAICEDEPWAASLVGRMGIVQEPELALIKLGSFECQYQPWMWGDNNTLRVAHEWLIEHIFNAPFDHPEKSSAALMVDCRVIRGETSIPATPSYKEAL